MARGQTNALKEMTKKLVFRHTSWGAPSYDYGVEPIQLAQIINGIERTVTKDTRDGAIVEIGVARGMTSRFIAEHLAVSGYDIPFYCLDTFSSFTEEDTNYEKQHRGKANETYMEFQYNDFSAWARNFAQFPFVKPVQCDASDFDFSAIAPIHFCFLDVDFYLPTRNVLRNILPHMAPNAMILVDDVKDKSKWDGAFQAFGEFISETGLESEIFGNKCGAIYIPK